jgi:dienelactone hydrolase
MLRRPSAQPNDRLAIGPSERNLTRRLCWHGQSPHGSSVDRCDDRGHRACSRDPRRLKVRERHRRWDQWLTTSDSCERSRHLDRSGWSPGRGASDARASLRGRRHARPTGAKCRGLRTLAAGHHSLSGPRHRGRHRDDRLLGQPGAFPIVIFIHGFDTSADTYAAMEHDLASAGFIVAAPEFPYTSSASAAGLNEDDVVNQAADVSFVIDSLTTAPPAVLTGHVASTKVGVVGHSDGAVTALGVADNSCCADPRIGAAVPLSGAEARFGGTWFPPGSPPLLAIHGTDDQVNAFASSQQVFADAPAPKYLVAVTGGSHLGPFTTDPVRPSVSDLVSDFLRAELTGDAQAASRIPGDASSGGLQLAASG